MRPVFLQAIAWVEQQVLAGPDGYESWNPDGHDVPPDPRRFFPDQPRLARLDLPSRYVICAAGLLPPPCPDMPDATSVILGSSTGSLDADLAFAKSINERPSPATYARTLPSTPGAELAILRGYRGANFAIIQDSSAGVAALVAAIHEVSAGSCEAAVAGEFGAVSGVGCSGFATLCILGSRPSPQGRSRQITVVREASGDDGPPARLDSLLKPFLDLPGSVEFDTTALMCGSLVRIHCGPAQAR